VSHEIRTPLNIINGFSQVLTDETNTFEPAERHAIAETIGHNTRQITSLVNKMLALANMNTKDLLKEVEETDAVDICRRAIATMPPIDSEKIKMIFEDRTNGSAKLMTNSDCLLQILGNILENAAKFTVQGHIRLTVENTEKDMRFAVEDTGCGIPTDKIDTIFDRFMKVDEFTEGLGLGLAYCHETTERLGGTLVLESTSSMGTTFVLTLPIKLKTN
jgi:signal transduction histidine kinase